MRHWLLTLIFIMLLAAMHLQPKEDLAAPAAAKAKTITATTSRAEIGTRKAGPATSPAERSQHEKFFQEFKAQAEKIGHLSADADEDNAEFHALMAEVKNPEQITRLLQTAMNPGALRGERFLALMLLSENVFVPAEKLTQILDRPQDREESYRPHSTEELRISFENSLDWQLLLSLEKRAQKDPAILALLESSMKKASPSLRKKIFMSLWGLKNKTLYWNSQVESMKIATTATDGL